MTDDSMTLLKLVEKYGGTESLIELIAFAESRLSELGESVPGFWTEGTRMRNPMVAAMVTRAIRGDTESARLCLLFTGLALKHSQPIDPTLRDYVGDALINVARKTDRHANTEKRAQAAAKALGLIAKRRGPKYHGFKPVRRDLQLACLARLFCDESGDQIVRDTHLKRAANLMGLSVSTARTAYRRFEEFVEEPDGRNGVHSIARFARTRKRRGR